MTYSIIQPIVWMISPLFYSTRCRVPKSTEWENKFATYTTLEFHCSIRCQVARLFFTQTIYQVPEYIRFPKGFPIIDGNFEVWKLSWFSSVRQSNGRISTNVCFRICVHQLGYRRFTSPVKLITNVAKSFHIEHKTVFNNSAYRQWKPSLELNTIRHR